jgi:branched-chain amino acid transport system permease protein
VRPAAAFGIAALVVAAGLLAPKLPVNTYYFYAGYVVLQFVAVATAWNVLGGYGGYINFGAAAFFGAGAYAAAGLFKAFGLPLPLQIMAAAGVGVALGAAMGYLTLRVQGVYFAIATLSLVVVLETLVHNVEYLGGARGLAILAPPAPAWFGGRTQFAFFVMLAVAAASVLAAWLIENSWIGRGLRAIRASESAAECAGVPTLKLKILACAVSGGLLAAAGAPYPYYASYIEPGTAFSLTVGLNAIAMPLIGGTRSWAGPVMGAVLLGTLQQVATVTISSELNVLLVGLALIAFVAAAPNGLLSLPRRPRSKDAIRHD